MFRIAGNTAMEPRFTRRMSNDTLESCVSETRCSMNCQPPACSKNSPPLYIVGAESTLGPLPRQLSLTASITEEGAANILRCPFPTAPPVRYGRASTMKMAPKPHHPFKPVIRSPSGGIQSTLAVSIRRAATASEGF